MLFQPVVLALRGREDVDDPEPKSTRTQCDAAVPSRPIGFVFSSRRLRDDPVRDGTELPLDPPEQMMK